MRKALFYLLMIGFQVVLFGAAAYFTLPMITARLKPQLFSYMAANLSDAEREEMYTKIAESFGSAWETTPDPNVGRLARKKWKGVVNQADITTNNAGLRSSRVYEPKKRNTFRIVCLGDSFVFGGGGREEDRFCNQIEDFYTENNIRPDGRKIETYALGLGSWTLVQEATYLSRRISEYDPDVIVMLSVANDITESSGVTGAGVVTRDFGIDSRRWGSGIFHNTANVPYKGAGYSAIQWDLSPASRGEWERGFTALKRLVELQHQRDGKMLFSVLNSNNANDDFSNAFCEIFKTHLREHGLEDPVLEVTYQKSQDEMRLPHDGHPSRLGHGSLRDQYVLALDDLGWVELDEAQRPTLLPGIELMLGNEPNEDQIAAFKSFYAERYLREKLDFGKLRPRESNALLGGIFPERKANASVGLPWASIRAGFLLYRKEPAETAELVIRVPERMELFPFRLEAFVNGELVLTEELASTADAGEKTLSLPLTKANPILDEIVEITLYTDSYFGGISDGRMKSYQLVSAELR